MTNTKTISPADVQGLLADLLGTDVQVSEGKPSAPSKEKPVLVTTFANDKGEIVALWIADVPLAASAGAALTRVPAGQVDAAIAAASVTGELGDNYREVANVGSALFNDVMEHVVLRDVRVVPPLATDIAVLFRRGGHRLDLNVSVAGYSSGVLSVVSK